MDTYTLEFYDLLNRALGGNDSHRLQSYLDTVMADKYNGLHIDGFDFAPDMQVDFTYEQFQRETKMNVMAQYVDLDSPAIPLGTEGAAVATGKIPRMKLVDYFNEDKLRKQIIAERMLSADAALASAKDKFFNTVDTLIGGHTNSLTYQRHQIVSTGKFTLTDTNNPNGIINQTFAAHVPAANVTTLAGENRWWKSYDSSTGVYSSEGSSCNPVKDLKAIVRKAKDRGVKGHFELNDAYADQVADHSKILEAIAIKLYPGAGDSIATFKSHVSQLQTSDKLAELSRLVGAPIKTVDSVVSVEKWNSSTKKLERPQFQAFDENVLVFVPDGKIGEVLTVLPISVGGTVGTFYGGRLLLTVGVDYVRKCQSYNTEMTTLVVPDKAQYFYHLHPYGSN